MRHGEAHHSSPDHLRELTEAGRKEVTKSLSKSLDRIPTPEGIYHSGLTRAAQTADIAASILAPNLQPQLIDGITPWGDAENFSKALENESAEALLLVTHNPFVEDLVYFLTGESLRIKTGSLVAIDVDFLARGCCTLRFVQH